MSWFRSSRRRPSPPPPEPRLEPEALEEGGPPVEPRAEAEEPLAGEAPAGARAVEAPAAEAAPAQELARLALADLHALARGHGVPRYRLLRRDELIGALAPDAAARPPARPAVARRPRPAPPEPRDPEQRGRETRASGVLDVTEEGGFVRVGGLVGSEADPSVSRAQMERLGLRAGDEVTGAVRPPRRGERRPAIVSVVEVNGAGAEALAERAAFEELRIARPDGPLRLGRRHDDVTGRMIDLVAPVGRGQRGLVAGPPGAGASVLLREVARALEGDDPHVIAVLCDVRPEELLDWEPALGLELHAATAEHPPERQRAVAELALERAKRLVEGGRDVVMLLDSITRLARACALGSLAAPDAPDADAPLDGAAVHAVKRWFASARNTTDAGSLTILAAVRAGSDSRLEAAVYEGLADTANLGLRLDGDLAAAGRRPALDLARSRTLHEEGLVEELQLRRLEALRGLMRTLDADEAWRYLAEKLRETDSNEQLLAEQR